MVYDDEEKKTCICDTDFETSSRPLQPPIQIFSRQINSLGKVSLECRGVEGKGLEGVYLHGIGCVRLEFEENAG